MVSESQFAFLFDPYKTAKMADLKLSHSEVTKKSTALSLQVKYNTTAAA